MLREDEKDLVPPGPEVRSCLDLSLPDLLDLAVEEEGSSTEMDWKRSSGSLTRFGSEDLRSVESGEGGVSEGFERMGCGEGTLTQEDKDSGS